MNGQMTVSDFSWKILTQSMTPPLISITLLSHFYLLHHGFISTMMKSPHKRSEYLRDSQLDGGYVPVQFFWATPSEESHCGTIPLQLGLDMGISLSLMPLQAARQLCFQGTQMK